jgi:hypothetical protein
MCVLIISEGGACSGGADDGGSYVHNTGALGVIPDSKAAADASQ